MGASRIRALDRWMVSPFGLKAGPTMPVEALKGSGWCGHSALPVLCGGLRRRPQEAKRPRPGEPADPLGLEVG